ncbi:MAG: putative capsid protein [Cressdnaviricota sp.]|nr:MAG: putative capsid protein [Cressdnaviricota sp.]
MVRRYYRRRFVRRNTRRSIRRYTRRPTRAFRRKVQRVLYRTAETKYTILNFSGNFQGLINWWGCPDILVGANKNNRIGNKIWARWLTFDINLLHSAAQGANLDTVIAHTVRLVWPKNMSNAEAVTHLNLTEFPVYDARNEENWILIKEWKFTTHNTEPANPQDYAGSTTMKRIKFAWAMNRKLEYSSNTDVTPEKNFYLVFSSQMLAGTLMANANIKMDGTFRVSYKDI